MIRLVACLLAFLASAGPASEPVVGFGVATLPDAAMAARLAGRFKAHGAPVFLIGNPSSGLAQGDLVKFTDRAVLIDADVWQTLQVEGALDALRASQGTVVQLRARARESAWEERRRLVTSPRDRKGYALGATLLRNLQATTGTLPEGRLQLSFEHGDLVILASRAFLDALKASPAQVDASPEAPLSAHPLIVSPPPPSRVFAGRPFRWTAWALDSLGGPSAGIRLDLLSTPPEGMRWDPASHTLEGTWPEGSWLVSVVARTTAGRTDSLASTVVSRSNRLPRLGGNPPIAWIGEPWSFVPTVSDSDHPAESLRVEPLAIPAGAVWDPVRAAVDWTPPDSLSGRVVAMGLGVRDPLGDSTDSVFAVRVERRDPRIATEGLAPRLPWDTLVEGREVRWSATGSLDEWRRRDVRLVDVSGSDSTIWDGATLRVLPRRSGSHEVVFRFEHDGRIETRTVAMPVRADARPVWRSATAGPGLRRGDTTWYRPVAIDPEGDSVAVSCVGDGTGELAWDGERLRVVATGQGWIRADCRARDAHGREATQTLVWQVPAPAGAHRWSLDYERHSVAAPVQGQVRSGAGRLGFLVVDMKRTFGWSSWKSQDWPMLFVGANLLGGEGATRDDQLWIDLGGILRSPMPRLITGGVMARIEGNFHPASPVPFVLEVGTLGWVHQGIIAVDTSSLRLTLAPGDSLGSVLDIRDAWEPALRQVMEDAYARRNMVFLTRLEGWWTLRKGIEAGPVVWREDRLVGLTMRQYLGAGVRGGWNLGPVNLRPSIRGGWGSGEAGWGVWGDLRIGSRE